MRKFLTITLILFTALLTSCSLSFDPESPLYKEERHNNLSEGTYKRTSGSYIFYLTVENAENHSAGDDVTLSVFMKNMDGDEVLLTTFTGSIEHERYEYNYYYDGSSRRVHHDAFVFTSSDGQMIAYDKEDLSGVYEIVHTNAADVSPNEYGHVWEPVAGSTTYLKNVSKDHWQYDDFGGKLEGFWHKMP